MGAALKFKTADVPRQASEKARLKVVFGPDLGTVFVISGLRASIGRGEENDIVLTDLKTSRKHAEFVLVNNQWTVQDAGSANGITHNTKKVKTAVLKTSDTVTLGETTIEFVSPEAGTQVLRALPRDMNEIKADQAAFSAQQKRVRELAQIGAPTARRAPGAAPAKSQGNPRVILLLAAVGAAAYFFMGGNDPAPVVKKKAPEKSLATYLPQVDSGPVNRSAEVFFRSGFREYREKNYLRARTQFETVLQISPGHQLATLYLANCNKAIEDEVKFDLDQGRKDYEAGSLKQAKLHYESIMRLLFRDQSNPAYVEAKDQLGVVTKEMTGE
jgi:pSer/pThr/pTyr-binding forkhead associated (FHA) protein